MLVRHLIESPGAGFSEIWKQHTPPLVQALNDTKDPDAEMLARVIDRSVAKLADTNPLALTPLLSALIKLNSTLKVEVATYDLRRFLGHLVTGFTKVLLATDEKTFRLVAKKLNLSKLESFLEPKMQVDLQLAAKKVVRSAAQKEIDRENELFIFIGRPTFVERPNGSGNFKKTLEIERLVKIDPYDAKSHQMAQAMKMRARWQGEKSEVYQVLLPKGTVKDPDDLDNWLIQLIDGHKKEVR